MLIFTEGSFSNIKKDAKKDIVVGHSYVTLSVKSHQT